MAAFRTHFSTGVVTGYLAAAISVVAPLQVTPTTPFYVFCGTCIGSILPDLDSDNSTPFSIAFGVLSILAGSLAFAFCVQQREMTAWRSWLWIPPLVALVVRHGVAKVFQKLTSHRGIFHSLPMMVIVTGIAASVLEPLHLDPVDALMVSLSVGLGFLSHLVLDEIYSGVSFEGLVLGPKKSFGTALTLTSPSIVVTLLTYLVLAAVLLWNWSLIRHGLAVLK